MKMAASREISRQGSASRINRKFSPYGCLKIDLCDNLDDSDVEKLATVFNLPRGTQDEIKRKPIPSLALLRALEKRCEISKENVDNLIKGLNHISCVYAAKIAEEFKLRYLSGGIATGVQTGHSASHEANPGSSTIGLSPQRTEPPPDQSDPTVGITFGIDPFPEELDVQKVRQPIVCCEQESELPLVVWIDATIAASSVQQRCSQQLEFLKQKIWQESSEYQDHLSELVILIMKLYHGDLVEISDDQFQLHLRISSLDDLHELQMDVWNGELAGVLQGFFFDVMFVEEESTSLQLKISLDEQSVTALESYIKDTWITDIQDSPFFCDYCMVFYQEEWQHTYHIQTATHKENIAVKDGDRHWEYREPLSSITNGEFKYCPDYLSTGKCETECQCPYAHSKGELREWQERHTSRLKVIKNIEKQQLRSLEKATEVTVMSKWKGLIKKYEEEKAKEDGCVEQVGKVSFLESVEDKIAQGSYNVLIYIGEYEDEYVAVKELPRQSLQKEKELYEKMKDRDLNNVLKISCIEENRRHYYVVTPLCVDNLTDLVEKSDSSSLSKPKQIKLCLDILNGLKGLHALDIIHRDLKPSNVLINEQGEAFLADFGISRNLQGQTTLLTEAFGTPCWLASECCNADGNTAIYKKASDIQVAAFLMYYILTNGHHPFEEDVLFKGDLFKLQINIRNGNFKLDHLKDFPEECKSLLTQMLSKDPYKRPTIEDCLQQMKVIKESCIPQRSNLTFLSIEDIKMSLSDVEVICEDLFVDLTERKPKAHSWTFQVKSETKQLQGVSLRHSRQGLFYFPVKSPEGNESYPKEHLVEELTVLSNGSVCFKVDFHVKGDRQCGLFDQLLILDFGEMPFLCQQLLVWIDPNSRNDLYQEDDSWESCQIVKYDTTVSADDFSSRLLKKYPLKELPISAEQMDCPTQETFSDYFKRMTWEEEKACKKKMERFNGKHKMLARKEFDHGVHGVLNLDKHLWGKITMTTAFDDSEASELVRKCVRMVWLKFDHHPNIIYEAEIAARHNLDLREFDNFYIKLSEKCVDDQGLQDGWENEVLLQFQIDRMPFCKQLYAIDNFKETQLLFPPTDMFPRFLTVNQDAKQIPRDDGICLNHRQEEAKNFICKAKNIVPFRQGPSLLIGPFGTGKTLTLAQTITEIIESDDESKFLVCTHSDSAADLFFTKYLKNFFDERQYTRKEVLRLYAADREPLSTPLEIREAFCIYDPNDGKFAKPTTTQMYMVRIVITTLSTAIHLVALKGMRGVFTHIFVDEAGQALETETMMPLALAGPRTVVMLSGDHKQLRPRVFSEMARRHQFRPSMLERLFYWSHDHNCNNTHFLVDNYRMEQDILDFIGVHCYQSKHFKAVTSNRSQTALPPVAFSAVQGIEEKREMSYINNKEAEEIVAQVIKLKSNWPAEWGDFRDENQVAVLASYGSQVKHLKNRLQRKKDLSNVIVDTVQNIQGNQFQVVFVSSVRMYMKKQLDPEENPNSDYLGIISDEGELITAFTRARSCLFVVGDPLALCNVGGCRNIWKSYIGLCRQKNSLKYPESIEAEINSICATADVQDSVMNDSLVTSSGLQPPTPGLSNDESVYPDSYDIEIDYETYDQDLDDEILKELDKQVIEEQKRKESKSKLDEGESVTEEQSSKEKVASEIAEKRAKPGKKRKGHRYRLLEGEERVVLQRIVVGDQKRSQLEGAFLEEEEEEEEDMSDEEQKEFYLKQAREDPEKYPFCLVRFAKHNKVYGIPCGNHSVDKISLSNKRRRKRALDGDQAVVKVISNKDDNNDVTYGEVMWVQRHTDLKWKKIVCTLDPDNIGLMCPIECRGLQMYPKMFIFPSGGKQTTEGIEFFLYSINPKSQDQKIQCGKRVYVRYVDMRDKLFVVQYSQWFDTLPYPMGIVTDKLPECNSLLVGIKILNLQHGVKEKWPNSLLQHNSMQFSSDWQVPTKELEQRQAYDLRKKQVFTIGNPGYGDFALHIEKFENNAGFQLGIHITDVAYFIGKDTLLDKEVLKRASSFYNDVSNETYVASHMLPEVLSTNLCMFKPGKDRLAVSIILTLDESNASVRETVIGRSVVSCKQNLTFEEVENFLSNHYNGKAEFEDNITEQLEMLYKISTFVSPVDPIQMLKDKNFINYPSAVTLIQKVVSLLNDTIVSKLDVFSGPKLVYHQLPIPEVALKDWSETFKDDACSLLNPPSMITQELENSGNGTKDEYMPLLRGTHEDVNSVLKYGKDKILELEKILVCVDRFPQHNAALAQLRSVIPPKELIVTEAVSSLNLYRYPCLAPLRSFPDLISQRMLIAILEDSENPYRGEDISHIAHHCFRQMENAQKYEENVEMLVLALKLKVVPHSLQAVVHSASDEKLELTYPFQKFLDGGRSSTAVAQCHLKPGKRPEKVESKAKSIQLNWRNRIYDYETKQVNLRSHNNKLWLSTHEHIHHIPKDEWQHMVNIVRHKTYLDLAELEEKWPTANQRQLQRKDIHEDKSEVITEVTCERVETKKGSSELKKYVEFNRQFNPGDVVQVQMTSKMQHGIPAPAIQLIKLTPKHGICLEHRAMPVECFTEIADRLPPACTTIQEYRDAWTPLLKMLIAYTTIMNDETIVIHGISINWFKKDGSVCGRFTLEKKWCDDRQIILSVLQRKKKGKKSDPPDPSEKSVLSDYICVRLNGYKLTDTVRSNLQKLGSKELSDAWKTEIPLPSSASLIVHGIAGTTNIGRPSDTENYDMEFQVTQKSCELPDELFDNQEPVTCTVELIPKSEPEKRMEAALATIGNGGEIVKNIVLQESDFHIDDELQTILDHGKRKLDNKDVFVPHFNVDNASLNDSQKEAVRLALSQPFTVIQGPPGTGKTRTGAYLTVLLADINREVKNKKQILYCGPSNKSVDVIAMYLQKFKTKKMKFVRVYSDFIEELDFPIPGVESAERKFTRDIEEVQKTDIQKDSLHYLIRSQNCTLSVKINQMYKKLKDGTLHPTLKNIRKYKALVKSAKIEVLKKMEVILCTCSASGHFILKENLDILQCVIDEAGMCFELDTLVPLVCHTPKQVVLIGDHKQLRPIIQEPRVKQLGADISLMEKYQGTAHTLSIQYRMHVEICKFPSKEFYDNQLITDKSVNIRTPRLPSYIWPGKDRVPQVFCHIEGLEDTQTVKTSEGNENSRSNRIEAKEIVRVAKYLVDQRKVKQEDVAILSQYKLQCNIIHKMLQKTHPNIKVQTIIKSQGSEWDYVLLSTVRSLPEDEIPETPGKSWRRTNLGFIEDENQMNVGITRAMQGLIIIGNRNLLKTCKIWRKLLEHFENIHAVIPADQFPAKGAQKTKKTSS